MPKIKTKKFHNVKLSKNSIADKINEQKAKKLALLMVKEMEEKILPDLKIAFYSEIKNNLNEIKNMVIEQDGFANGLESRISEIENFQTSLNLRISKIETHIYGEWHMPEEYRDKTVEELSKELKKIFELICKKCGKELKEGHKCEPENSASGEVKQ